MSFSLLAFDAPSEFQEPVNVPIANVLLDCGISNHIFQRSRFFRSAGSAFPVGFPKSPASVVDVFT